MCLIGGAGSGGAKAWVDQHGEDGPIEWSSCCYGAAMAESPLGCVCWEPVYDLQQEDPRPQPPRTQPDVMAKACSDCAYRSDSPERASEYRSERLIGLTYNPNTPFYCHTGMRRPQLWRHPDGRTVPGHPDDYDPPCVDGVPYQADGTPGLVCAGWAVRYDQYRRELAARAA